MTLDEANRQRANDFLVTVYGEERAAKFFDGWGVDAEFVSRDVCYGLIYADDGVLDFVETEVIIYTAIACQGLHVPLVNHAGGLKRMGLSLDEVEGVTACAKRVAEWAGQDTSAWRPVRDVLDWEL